MSKEIEIVAKHWNEYSPQFDEAHNTENLDVWRKELGKLISGNQGAKVLDIGTGTGFLALMVAELGYESYGIDIAEDMLELGRQHAKERNVSVNFLNGEGEHLPFEDNCFEALVNARVLWTLLDPDVSFSEWIRVIKPDGKLLSFIRHPNPDKQIEPSFYGEEFDIKLPLRQATNELYIEYMERAGFKNVKIIPLPEEMSRADATPWMAVYGEK